MSITTKKLFTSANLAYFDDFTSFFFIKKPTASVPESGPINMYISKHIIHRCYWDFALILGKNKRRIHLGYSKFFELVKFT